MSLESKAAPYRLHPHFLQITFASFLQGNIGRKEKK